MKPSMLTLVLLLPQPSSAQGSDDAGTTTVDLAAEVAELRRRVEILGQELESQRTGSAPVVSTTDMEPKTTGLGPAASKVYAKDGLSIGGYGEAILSAFPSRLQNGSDQPKDNLGDTLRAVFYVGYKFNDWVVFNSEVELEHSGFSDEHAEGEVIVEFAYLDFLLARWLNVRVGQVLLPVGFINELHEPPIFLGALRPQLEQASGIIPTTWHELGVGLTGELPANLTYRVYLLNGLNAAKFNAEDSGAIGGGRQDGHQVIANKPAVSGRLDWHPVPGALLGGSFYAGDSAQARGSVPIWTVLLEGHAEYRARGFQARAIYAWLSNSSEGLKALGTGSEALNTGTLQSGWYLEAGFDVLSLVPATRQTLIPFARYESVNTQQAVAEGATVNLANRRSTVTVGLNYKPIAQVAVKAGFSFNMNAALTGQNQLDLAVGYLF